MPVSGFISITLKYEDIVKIDKLKKDKKEKRTDVIRRAIRELEEKWQYGKNQN